MKACLKERVDTDTDVLGIEGRVLRRLDHDQDGLSVRLIMLFLQREVNTSRKRMTRFLQ